MVRVGSEPFDSPFRRFTVLSHSLVLMVPCISNGDVEGSNALIVSASSPPPPGTSYRISIGIERADSAFLPVIKVQMIFDGEVSERSPSFPLGTDDHLRVNKTIEDLLKKHVNIIAEK